jgi:hypothetical protein
MIARFDKFKNQKRQEINKRREYDFCRPRYSEDPSLMNSNPGSPIALLSVELRG